ncbi:hypothetical protein [uncultured Microbacterium sp.]|uniref:hypothetical protein n=1 Tax=uncultured Microbacterium sp. TaxID=191216 RepID=UPI0025CE0035|nr:hypothetical protein [uncultured Microbacterium sp.]
MMKKRQGIAWPKAVAIATVATTSLLIAVPAAATTGELPYPTEPYIDENGHYFDPANPFVDENESGLSSAGAGDSDDLSTKSAVIRENPYGCHGLTENVHRSGSFASLHARTYRCSAAPREIQVSAEIVKLGYLGAWHSLGATPREDRRGTQKAIDSNRKLVCSDSSQQTYRGNGHHRVLIGDTNYFASTSSESESRFGCNAHRP